MLLRLIFLSGWIAWNRSSSNLEILFETRGALSNAEKKLMIKKVFTEKSILIRKYYQNVIIKFTYQKYDGNSDQREQWDAKFKIFEGNKVFFSFNLSKDTQIYYIWYNPSIVEISDDLFAFWLFRMSEREEGARVVNNIWLTVTL